MREIKFRVRNVEEMGEVITVDWLQKRVVYLRKDDKEMFSAYFKDCKLMQYTGLKDKNGVEIFEGDVVLWIDSDGNGRKDEVFFENGGFRICNSIFEISEYGELEVIGNIYENKELWRLKDEY